MSTGNTNPRMGINSRRVCTGEFMEYFGKSLSADEMDTKMGALIRDWERERFLREVLPAPIANFLLPQEPEWMAEARREASEKR